MIELSWQHISFCIHYSWNMWNWYPHCIFFVPHLDLLCNAIAVWRAWSSHVGYIGNCTCVVCQDLYMFPDRKMGGGRRNHSSGAVWESRWPSWAVRPNEPSGFGGRKAILNHASALVSACLKYVNWHLKTLSNTAAPQAWWRPAPSLAFRYLPPDSACYTTEVAFLSERICPPTLSAPCSSSSV